jgi:hypothetical protein
MRQLRRRTFIMILILNHCLSQNDKKKKIYIYIYEFNHLN